MARLIAARGTDIDEVDLVVNVDPPATAKDYLHRGGRTARAGRLGTVVTVVLPEPRCDVVRLVACMASRARRNLFASYAQAPRHLNTVGRTSAQLTSLRTAAPT